MGDPHSSQRRFKKVPSGDFQSHYRTGRKAAGKQLVLIFQEHETRFSFAVVASRRVGNAVQRNRAKRLLREAFRSCALRLEKPGAYVLVARAALRDQKLSPVIGELTNLLTRLNLISDP
jgi:ribonuclease P protein component